MRRDVSDGIGVGPHNGQILGSRFDGRMVAGIEDNEWNVEACEMREGFVRFARMLRVGVNHPVNVPIREFVHSLGRAFLDCPFESQVPSDLVSVEVSHESVELALAFRSRQVDGYHNALVPFALHGGKVYQTEGSVANSII